VDTKLVALAIPFFFVLIGIEVAISYRRRASLYRLHDAISSMACGIGEQVIVVFTAGAAIAAYLFVEKHLALTVIPRSSVLAWVAVFFLVDHSYYWFHRSSHRVNFMWAGHAVHHQSEEYNLSTALRQNWIENLLAWPFYVPLALVGFPFLMFATASTVNLLYQFWVHTRAIGKLGRAEGLLNTPSSHRVHHGIDPKYVDRNYGGMFMLWDRMYGTYQPEEEEPIYGTVKPLESWSPLWAQLEGWARLVTMTRGTARLGDKVRVWFAPPDWRPDDLGGPVVVPEVDRALYRKYAAGVTAASAAVDRYVMLQFLVITAATSSIMWFATVVPRSLLAASSGWVLAAVIAWSGLFEGKPWARPLEITRHVAGVGLGFLFLTQLGVSAVLVVAAVSALISATLLVRIHEPQSTSIPSESETSGAP
jgi:alkylglycerol monooxygenase